MTAKQTDDRTKTDSLQQMTATYKKNRKIILFCSTQEKKEKSFNTSWQKAHKD